MPNSPGDTAPNPPDAATFPQGSFLAMMSERERLAVLAIGVERSFAPGAALMLQGEPDDRVMILLAGRVKVVRTELDGRDLMLEIRDPGDLIGELAFIDGEPRVATVTALEHVRALVTPAAALRAHLETTPRVAVLVLATVARRFRVSNVTRSQFGVSDTFGRVAARILELAERYGVPTGDGRSVVSPLSLEDLAAWTGASRAGVAEAMRAQRDLGWIQTEGKRILVRDAEALRARAP